MSRELGLVKHGSDFKSRVSAIRIAGLEGPVEFWTFHRAENPCSL